MVEFSKMRTLDLWYYRVDADERVSEVNNPEVRRHAKRLDRAKLEAVIERE
jgi:hypothetical protein